MRSKILIMIIFLMFGMMVKNSYSGTTGKISGIVTDQETEDPLPGANVMIEGTSLGAATDSKGAYAILNVPPGTYSLNVSMMGYKKHIIKMVRVSIDLTTTINANLEATVLDAEESVTVVAERPMIAKDMTSSMVSVSSKEIQDLPVQTVSEVIELQAGIVNSGGIHIRGGRSGEVAYWVDGVATTNVFNNSSTAVIENSAVQELQVISGTFNAEYGQAMSGIINIITKDGDSQYHGQIKGYFGDYLSSDDIYSVMDHIDTEYDSSAGTTIVKEYSENPIKKLNPTYNGEFSLSGPVPFLKDKLTFFTNGRYYSNEGYLYGREWFLPSNVPGDSSLVPLNPSERWSALAKLTWKPFNNIKVNYSLNLSEWENEKNFDRDYRYVPGGIPKSFGNTQTHLLTINHVLSPATFYELKINRMNTESNRYVYDDPNLTPNWLVRVPADSVNAEMTFDPKTTDGAVILDSLQQYGFQYDWVADPNQADGYVHSDSARVPVSYSFLNAGNDLGRSYQNTAYWIAKFDLTSQLNKRHLLKTGFELRLHRLKLDSYTLIPKKEEGTDEDIVPFQPVIPEKSHLQRDYYVREPREFSIYLQDKLEFRDIILNVGLRYDYFDANSVIPADPLDPNIYAPLLDAHIYKNPEAADSLRVEYTPDERRAFMHTKVDAKMQLSPRLGIAYPITDKGAIHFSYGHFFQIPSFQYLYARPDFKITTGRNSTILGNADLNPQKTVQYELGLQQQITDDIGIDITVFYRDVRDWVGGSPLKNTYNRITLYSTYENRDYENVRGVTLKVEKRYTGNFYARIDYSYMVAEGTYSDPNDAFYAALDDEEPQRHLIPMNWDQRHTLNAQMSYRLNNWTISMIGKYMTGLPYTPTFAKGAFVGGSALSSLPTNSSRLPVIKTLDLRLVKIFNLTHNLNMQLFAYVYNLLDSREATSVFSDTGSTEYTTFPIFSEVPYSPMRISSVNDYYSRPEWYIAPRQIQLGISFDF